MPDKTTDEEKKRRTKKVESLRRLSDNIQSLRVNVTKDLGSDDEKKTLTALVIAVIDKSGERVGNDSSASDGHFGVTGLQSEHVTVNGNKVVLKYVGKSGVDHEKEFTDEKIAKLLKKYKDKAKKGEPLFVTSDGFKIKADKVNRYLKDYDITAKDIRGYAANNLVINALKRSKTISDEDERKKKFREVLKSVAETIGHQQATLKMHYLLPGVEEDYVKRGKIKQIKQSARLASSQDVVEELIAISRLLQAKAATEKELEIMVRDIGFQAKIVFEYLFGKKSELGKIVIGFDEGLLPEGKIAGLVHPENGSGVSKLIIRKEILNDLDYLREVVKHEMIHGAIGEYDEHQKSHGEIFNKMAEVMDLDPELRD